MEIRLGKYRDRQLLFSQNNILCSSAKTKCDGGIWLDLFGYIPNNSCNQVITNIKWGLCER